MRKYMLPMIIVFLGFSGAPPALGQVFNDFIESTRGDTVVVRDYSDMGFVPNSLINAVELDTEAPEGRVYELKRGGLYWNTRQLATPQDRPLRIVGVHSPPKVHDSESLEPPILSGTTDEGVVINGDMIAYRNDLELKNLIAMPAATDASQGWTFLIAGSANNDVVLDNVLMEHTNWVMVQSNDFANNSLYISNSYFVNLSGEACRRNGGVYDNVSNNTNVLHVENSTHLMAQGMMYKFRNYPINEAFFNHNTFVNASGQLFTSFGYQSNLTIANNLFINSNVQGYHPGLDIEETDQDSLPHGIVNVAHIPSNYNFPIVPDAERKIMVDRNGVFWDDRLDEIVDVLNTGRAGLPGPTGPRNDRTDWVSQMLTMNSRTQEIFNDNSRYPLMTEGNWIMGGDPDFIEPLDLMTTQVDELIEYSIHAGGAGDYSSPHTLPKWRTEGNEAEDNYTFPDWPVPVNLAYNNSAYLTAGLGGLPLGDLNWFPELKSLWEANKEGLYAELQSALDSGRTPEFTTVSIDRESPDSPTSFALKQNYPNPFNPATQIQFTLQNNTDVKLEVFDVTGRLVSTILNQTMNAGTHTVTWDASMQSGASLSSGVYIYRLTAGDHVESRKMTLLK